MRLYKCIIMQIFRCRFALIRFVVLCIAGGGLAVNCAYSSDLPKAQISLVSNVDSIKAGNDLILGVQFKIPEGWQTYWRTPGDVGYGAKFSWEGSQNLDKAIVLWPFPKNATSHGFNENIYQKSITFPVAVSLKDPGKPLSIRLSIDYLLCKPESCVPLNQKLELELPAGNANSSTNVNLINQALLTIPHAGNTKTLAISNLQISERNDDKAVLRVDVTATDGLKNTELFIESAEKLKVNPPEFKKRNEVTGYFSFTAEKVTADKSAPSLKELLQKPLQFTLTNQDNAITVAGTPLPKANNELLQAPWAHIWLGLLALCVLLILGFVMARIKKN